MHITICITTVGCGCCMSMFTVFARQRNSYLRDPLSHFPVVFSPTGDYIMRPSFIIVSTTNNNHDANSSSKFSQEVVRDLPWMPKRDFPCAVFSFCRRPKTCRPETSPRQPIAAREEKTLVPMVLEISRPVWKLTCIPLDSMKALEHTTAAADPSAVGADIASVIGLHMVFDSLIYFKGISFLRHAYGLCTLCLWFL